MNDIAFYEYFEAAMVLCFGISWPMAIAKSIRSRTSKGKSLIFMLFIFVGYVFGIASKLIGNRINYVLIFYALNLLMVGIDIVLYFRNRRLDAIRDAHAAPRSAKQ